MNTDKNPHNKYRNNVFKLELRFKAWHILAPSWRTWHIIHLFIPILSLLFTDESLLILFYISWICFKQLFDFFALTRASSFILNVMLSCDQKHCAQYVLTLEMIGCYRIRLSTCREFAHETVELRVGRNDFLLCFLYVCFSFFNKCDTYIHDRVHPESESNVWIQELLLFHVLFLIYESLTLIPRE